MKIKVIFAVLTAMLILSSCTNKNISEFSPSESLESIKNAAIINIDYDSSSIKGKADIYADDTQICFKTEKLNSDYRQTEYFIKTNDNKDVFSVTATDPENISDKSFSMFEVYDFENNLCGYIQSDVFRGKESYIIYSDNKERYAFCDIESNSGTLYDEYKIISFDDELLYKICINNSKDNEFNTMVERMRPDYETDISAIALAFIISADKLQFLY